MKMISVLHFLNTLARAGTEEHVLTLLGAAGEIPEIAARFANGFDFPPDFFEWFMDPESAQRYLGRLQSASAARA